MNKEKSILKVKKEDYQVIPPGMYSKRQKYNILVYNNMHYKNPNQCIVASNINSNEEYADFFVCAHANSGCRAKFAVLKSGEGLAINQHNDCVKHLLEPQLIQRYKIKTKINEILGSNIDITPKEILIKLIKQFPLDINFPSLNFIQSYISRKKSEIIGPSPKNIDEINFEKLKDSFPEFCWNDI